MLPHLSSRGFVDLLSLMVGVVLLWSLFATCWLLLQVRDDERSALDTTAVPAVSVASAPASNASRRPDSAAGRRFDIDDLTRSRQSLTMGCVLLAGLVGGYLQYMRERFSELTGDKAPPAGSQDQRDGLKYRVGDDGTRALLAFLSQLLMGLGTASILGLFIPLAIANPPGLSIYNPWGLLIVGVVSGYLSRSLLGGLPAKLERLFAELKRSGPLGAIDVTSAVKQGVMDALGSPQPINFDGTVALDVVDQYGKSCVSTSDGISFVNLKPSAEYTARILFDQSVLPKSRDGRTNHKRIRIDRGVDARTVPFQIRLELSFLPERAPLEQSIELVARPYGNAREIEFGFTANEINDEASAAPTDVVLFVYQNSLFCAAVSLPVRWEVV